MENKYLSWRYMDIVGDMFRYYDGSKCRRNKKFFKSLWKLLHTQENVSIDDVFNNMNVSYSKNTKQMIRSNIKHSGQQWLEGLDGDIFGKRFELEYIRRWDIYNHSKK